MIEFKRGRRGPSEVAEQMVWPSKCGRFKLERHVGIFEDRTRWYALYHTDIWRMLIHCRTYRTRNAAVKALEKKQREMDGTSRKRSKSTTKRKRARKGRK